VIKQIELANGNSFYVSRGWEQAKKFEWVLRNMDCMLYVMRMVASQLLPVSTLLPVFAGQHAGRCA